MTSLDRASLNVTYEPPLPIDENGPITSYLIVYHVTGDLNIMSLVTTETELIISGLNPNVNHSVQVAARNVNGSGSFSSTITQLSGQDRKLYKCLNVNITNVNYTKTMHLQIFLRKEYKDCVN